LLLALAFAPTDTKELLGTAFLSALVCEAARAGCKVARENTAVAWVLFDAPKSYLPIATGS
jgi:hypothetical protein